MAWVLLGEVVVVLLEAMLLRRFFSVAVGQSLWMALAANAASFIAGAVLCIRMGVPGFLPDNLLDTLSDIFFDPTLRLLPGLSRLASQYFSLMGVMTFLTMLFEYPFYFFMLKGAGVAVDSGRARGKILLINLISYPLFYTALFVATAANAIYGK